MKIFLVLPAVIHRCPHCAASQHDLTGISSTHTAQRCGVLVVLANALDGTSVVVLALELVINDCGDPGNSVDEDGPVHVFGIGMRPGREEEHDPAEGQEGDGDQVDCETPTTQAEATRQERLLQDPLASHASNANDVRGQKTDAGQTGDYVESCVRADDDERDENSKNHRYSASIERNVHARSHLSKLVLVLGR